MAASTGLSGFVFVLLIVVLVLAAFLYVRGELGWGAWKLGGQGGGRPSSTFKKIDDSYETIEQVQEALRKAGLESSQMILAVDLTQSNTWTGRDTFGGRCLHALSPGGELNPYEEVIAAVGRTLSAFDDDGKIPFYGFGDADTTDKDVKSFGTCDGFEGVLKAYRRALPTIRLSGPTSFAPIIRKALEIVKATQQYSILVIIADGQISDPARTAAAIVEASKYPLSILCIGVGDGPWETMEEYDDQLPQRRFDNFQFVSYHSTVKRIADPRHRDATFALQALQEIPDQYRAIQRLKLI